MPSLYTRSFCLLVLVVCLGACGGNGRLVSDWRTPEVVNDFGGAARFGGRLNGQPLPNAVVTVTLTAPDELILIPDVLTFDASNWNVDQYVDVHGALDGDEGEKQIIVTVSSPQDITFNAVLQPPTLRPEYRKVTIFPGQLPEISGDGNFVVYQTVDLPALSPEDYYGFNPTRAVKIYNTSTGEHELVSVNNNGDPANDASVWPTVSDDGRYVTFLSKATNLHTATVPIDQTGEPMLMLYIRDRVAGTTTPINVDGSGEFYGGFGLRIFTRHPAQVSGDGSHVVHVAAGPARVWSVATGQTVQEFPIGTGQFTLHYTSVISDDATVVGYEENDFQGNTSYHWWEGPAGGPYVPIRDPQTLACQATCPYRHFTISGDGSQYADTYRQTNQDDDGRLYEVDTEGSWEDIDFNVSGTPLSGSTVMKIGAISTNGRFVSFASGADNIMTSDPYPGVGTSIRAFVRDDSSGTPFRIGFDASNEENWIGSRPRISDDGTMAVYDSRMRVDEHPVYDANFLEWSVVVVPLQ